MVWLISHTRYNCLSWFGRRGNNIIRCRLDRSMGNEDWYDMFSHTNVEYLHFMGSDHRPIMTHFLSKKMFGTKKFRFDKCWLTKPNFKHIIREGWSKVHNTKDPTLGNRIANCRTRISRWRKQDQLNSSEVIEKLKASLEEA